MGICPPRPIKLCATSGNTSTRQTPEAGPSTRRSTDYTPPLWCGHLKSHLYLSEIRHSQIDAEMSTYYGPTLYGDLDKRCFKDGSMIEITDFRNLEFHPKLHLILGLDDRDDCGSKVTSYSHFVNFPLRQFPLCQAPSYTNI